MYIQRGAYEKLLRWKASKLRKPLLIRGGRQVGKTTLIREFAKEFGDYIELSLEKEAERKMELEEKAAEEEDKEVEKAHEKEDKKQEKKEDKKSKDKIIS